MVPRTPCEARGISAWLSGQATQELRGGLYGWPCKNKGKLVDWVAMLTDLLKRCPLFAGLGDQDLRTISSLGTLKRLAKNTLLFSEGDEAKNFYVVVSGRVKLYKISSDGKEQILHIVEMPDAFAEAAFFLERYPACAEAISDSQLFSLPKRGFMKLIERNPRLSINMISSLSEFLHRLASLIEELSLKEVPARVAKYLIDLSLRESKGGKLAGEVELDVSKTQLALKLGTISETLSRTLAKLRTKQVITVQKNKVRILDWQALERIASGLKG